MSTPYKLGRGSRKSRMVYVVCDFMIFVTLYCTVRVQEKTNKNNVSFAIKVGGKKKKEKKSCPKYVVNNQCQ